MDKKLEGEIRTKIAPLSDKVSPPTLSEPSQQVGNSHPCCCVQVSLAASKVELETTKSLMRMDIDELTAAVKQLGPMVEELVTTHSSHCFCTRLMSALLLRHRPSRLRLALLLLHRICIANRCFTHGCLLATCAHPVGFAPVCQD